MSSGAVLADVAFNAQARVLGPMLVEPSVVGEVLLAVSDSEFTEGRYRLIYQAIRKLYNDGKPVDGLTVNDALGGNYNELLAEIINHKRDGVRGHPQAVRPADASRRAWRQAGGSR